MKKIKFTNLILLKFVLLFFISSQVSIAGYTQVQNDEERATINELTANMEETSDRTSNGTGDDPADGESTEAINTQQALNHSKIRVKEEELHQEMLREYGYSAVNNSGARSSSANPVAGGPDSNTLDHPEAEDTELVSIGLFEIIMPEEPEDVERLKKTNADFVGSNSFKNCQIKSSKKWTESFNEANWKNGWDLLYKKHGEKIRKAYGDARDVESFIDIASQGEIQQPYFLDYDAIKIAFDKANIKNKGQAINKSAYNQKVKDISKAYTAAIEAGKSMLKVIENCQGFLATTTYEEGIFDDTDYSRQGSKASFDGKIKCITSGGETQDYPGCSKMVNAYDALFVGRKVLDGYQAVDYAGFQQKERGKVDEDQGQDLTISLKAQRNTTDKQKELATQKIATEGAALATLMGFYTAMPSLDNLVEHCTSKVKEDHLNKIRDGFVGYQDKIISAGFIGAYPNAGYLHNETNSAANGGIYTPTKIDVSDDNLRTSNEICQTIIVNNPSQEFSKNEKARQAAKMAMVAAGVDIAKYGATIAILDKQSGLLDDAINKVNAFAPPDTTYSQDDLIKFECDVNPNLPKCPGAGDGLRANGFYDSGINIGGMNRATSDANHDLDVADAGARNAASDNTDGVHGNSLGTLGTGINRGNNSGGLADNGASAATVKKGGGGAGGGGGGAGGGSAAPPSNPGGGGGQKSAMPRGRKNSRRKYVGGGSTFKYGSGRGSRSSKKKSANPFKNMFNKKRKNGGKVLNYRGLASKGIGSKSGSIFDMLSHQYQSVNKRGRLIEYEKVK